MSGPKKVGKAVREGIPPRSLTYGGQFWQWGFGRTHTGNSNSGIKA